MCAVFSLVDCYPDASVEADWFTMHINRRNRDNTMGTSTQKVLIYHLFYFFEGMLRLFSTVCYEH